MEDTWKGPLPRLTDECQAQAPAAKIVEERGRKKGFAGASHLGEAGSEEVTLVLAP